MRKPTILLIPIALMFAVFPVAAQTCTPEDTAVTCWEKFVPTFTGEARAEAAEEAADDVGEAVAKTNTGNPVLANLANTALRDFLSTFAGVFQTSTLTENNGLFTLDYNLPLRLLHDNDVIKLQASFGKPKLDSALEKALGDNSEAISTLSDAFDETDDILASATYGPSTPRFGRSLANHRPLIEGLMNAIIAERGADDPARLTARYAKLLSTIDAPAGVKGGTDPFSAITNAADRNKAIQAIEAAARAQKDFIKATDTFVDDFAQLLNNQEQIHATAMYHERSNFAGANGWSVKGTWERGGKNLTRFLAKHGADCDVKQMTAEIDIDPGAAVSTTCLTKLREYLGDADQEERSWRFAFSGEVERAESNTIALPQYTIALDTPQSDSRIFSVTAGRRLDPPTSSRESRLDFTGSYEDVSGDPNRDNRFVASITLTQEINDNFNLPITLSYANKEKYLTDVDKKLSVNFGVSYKLPDLTQ